LWSAGWTFVGPALGTVTLYAALGAAAAFLAFGLSSVAELGSAGFIEVLSNPLVQELGYSAVVASLVTPTVRYVLGWHRLLSGYDWLLTFVAALVVLDVTHRLTGQRTARDYILALAGAYILLALFQPRPPLIRIP